VTVDSELFSTTDKVLEGITDKCPQHINRLLCETATVILLNCDGK
jgi:hypothetical protein